MAQAILGLAINFDRGKTEVLWNLAGRGTKQIKADAHLAGAVMKWTTQDGKLMQLPLCQEYKHLGSWLQTKHRHAREVAKRASAAKQQFGQMSRSFFTKRLSLDVRAKVFQSLVVSKLMFNVHTWAGVTPQDFEAWNNSARPMVAVMLRGRLEVQSRFQHTTDELFAACGILPLPDQLHAQRLRFLKRLLQACPHITWMLLEATSGPGSWMQLCRDSLRWLCRHHGGRLPVSPDASFVDWATAIMLDSRWKGKIRKATHQALAFHSAKARHQLWHQHLSQRLALNGATLPDPPAQKKASEIWQCDLCPKTFGSSRALAMHAARAHSYRKKVRYFAVGDVCPVCLQCFHT